MNRKELDSSLDISHFMREELVNGCNGHPRVLIPKPYHEAFHKAFTFTRSRIHKVIGRIPTIHYLRQIRYIHAGTLDDCTGS